MSDLSFLPPVTESHYRQIVQSAVDYAIVSCDLEGRVTSWNEGARRVLGWTEDEVRMLFFQQLRRKLNDVGIGLSPDREELLAQVQPVLAGG